MVREPAAHALEESMPLAQGVGQVLVAGNGYTAGFREFPDVFRIARLFDSHGFVRPPCRKHLDTERMLRYVFMVFEIVHRIVRSADHLYVEHLHESLTPVLFCLELFGAGVVYLPGCLRIQQVIHSEYAGQFQMCPVIKRIPHGVRYGLGPFFEFLIAASAARYEFFWHTVASHRTPLVVVSTEPHFREIMELVVFGYHLRHQMAVVVDDRHFFGALMIKFAGIFVGQHEVVIDEFPVNKAFNVLFHF